MASSDNDHRRHSPSAGRNRAAILDVLRRVVPKGAFVLEIASGTGEHAAWLAPRLDSITWQPSDIDPDLRASIAAWTRAEGAASVLPPLAIDACETDWGVEGADAADAADAIVCINMIHIAPWRAAEGLVAGAGRHLRAKGLLYLYGPFRRDGAHTAPSNADFDASLRQQNPDWGVRDIEQLQAAAQPHGLDLAEIVDMPSNNFSLIFRQS